MVDYFFLNYSVKNILLKTPPNIKYFTLKIIFLIILNKISMLNIYLIN